jgi:2-dehydro-3-deoxygluconokinase
MTTKTPKRLTPPVLCLGETMLMFAPPGHGRIEESRDFRAYVGGSEANVAVGLERLGVHAGWVGKLPRSALGRKVENGIRRYGVDTTGIVWADEGRVGTFYVEFGAEPRPTKTIYDRAGSAATTLTADDLDWDYVGGADWLHLTGITPALSATCRRSTPAIVRRARAHGVKVSFDVNYRSMLWSPDEARAAWDAILPHVNVLIATEPDAALLLDRALPREDALRTLCDRYAPDAVVMTCRGDGCVAFDGDQFLHTPTWHPENVHRIGAGDAFDAGLLYGLVEADLEAGLAYGNAMAALKFTVPLNLPLIDREDVDALLAGRDLRLVR